MAERKTGKELQEIMKEHNVAQLYSWSKYNLWNTDTYSWFLKYILKRKEDRNDGIYGDGGNVMHDLMEDFYLGNIQYDDLYETYKDKMFDLELSGKKFDRTDEDKNLKISKKYNACNEHYMQNFKPIIGDNATLEDFILIKVSKFLFQGYLDMFHEEVRDGRKKAVITDFKTSTIYKGAKIEKERGQLLLYALGTMQKGWDIEDIIIRWLFTKYVSVRVPTKDSYRYREILRNEIGVSLKSSVTTQLKKIKKYSDIESEKIIKSIVENNSLDHLGEEITSEITEIERKANGEIKKTYLTKTLKAIKSINRYSEFEIEMLIDEMIANNSLENMPQQIKDIFVIEDCFVEIPFNKDDIHELQVNIVKAIVDMNKKESIYRKTNDDSVFFSEIAKENEYFHAVLSGYSPKLHKPYKEYLDNLNMFKEDSEIEADLNDILEELGLDL